MNLDAATDSSRAHSLSRLSRILRAPLDPVEEEKDDETRRAASTHFLSDDDHENQVQQRAWRTATDKFDTQQLPNRARRRSSTTSRRLSTRQPLQEVPTAPQHHRHRDERLSITTLNERKQRKLVALFYWQRKTLEGHFHAWTTYLATKKQQYELKLLRASGYAPSPLAQAPRRSTVQRVVVDPRSRRSSTASISPQLSTMKSNSDRRERLRSLREEYRQLKAVDNASVDEEKAGESSVRTRLKENLRTYYMVFEAWGRFVHTGKQEDDRKWARAAAFHSRHVVERSFCAWSGSYLQRRRAYRAVCDRADTWKQRTWSSKRFHQWKSWVKAQKTAARWCTRIEQLKLRRSLSWWRKWKEEEEKKHCAAHMGRRRILRRRFHRLQAHTLVRQERRRHYNSAIACYQELLVRRGFRGWVEGVFNGETANRVQQYRRVLAARSSVTRWKRFLARKRENQERIACADHLRYSAALQRCIRRWQAYLSFKHADGLMLTQAEAHYTKQQSRRVIRLLLRNRCELQYTRNQTTGADVFYQQRLVERVFRGWHSETTLTRRALDFCCRRTRRRVVLCFVAWKQHTRCERRLLERGHVLQRHQCRLLKQRTLGAWLYTWRLTAALKHIQSTQRLKRLDSCVQAWRQISMTRIRHRGVMEAIAYTRSERIKRLLLRAWLQFVVSSRCRRRLVRLYSLKRSYKHLRRCLEALQCHAKTQQLQRRVQQRHLESAWHSWAVHSADQRHKRESMSLALQLYVVRRWHLGVDAWKASARRSIRTRQGDNKALGHLIHSTLAKAFDVWSRAVQKSRQCRAAEEALRTRTWWRTLRNCLLGWRHSAEQSLIRRQAFHRVYQRSLLRRRYLAFFAWRAFWRYRRAGRLRQLTASRWCRRRLGLHVFQLWRMKTKKWKQRRTVVECLTIKRRRQYLLQCFECWVNSSCKMKKQRQDLERATAFHSEYVLLTVLYGWQHVSAANQLMKAKQAQATERLNRCKLRRALATWQVKRDKHSVVKSLMKTAVQHYEDRRQRLAVGLWRSRTLDRVISRQATSRSVGFANTKLVKRCVHSWLAFTSRNRTFKLRLRVIFQTGDGDIQRRVFRYWRRYKRSSTLWTRASAWQRRFLLHKIWRAWRTQVEFSHKMKSHILITHKLLQSNSLRGSFAVWSDYTTARVKKRELVMRGAEHHRRNCCRRAVHRMKIAARHARAVALSVHFHSQHALRQHLRAWQRGVEQAKTKRASIARACVKYRQYQLRSALTGWKTIVQGKQNALLARAESFNSTIVQRRAWTAWTRAMKRTRVVEGFHQKRLRGVVRRAFSLWFEFQTEQRRILQLVNAAVAHVDKAVVSKFWAAWLVYIERQRVSHSLTEMAHRFYAVRVLQHRCFESWVLYINGRQRVAAATLQASVFCTTKRLRFAFERLEAYAEYRRQRALVKIAEDLQIRSLILKRGVNRWHDTATTVQEHHQLQCLANQFYTRRQLHAGIGSFQALVEDHKAARQHQGQAKSFWSARLQKTFLMRWRAFVSWRQRHKNLVRLFQTNQRSDFFARWRKYATCQRRKRSAQQTAALAYRRLMQRRVFATWLGCSNDWRNEREATQWCCRRLLHRTFDVWLHHAHVLMKMRRLFRYQDSYRLEVHFQAWKRRYVGKRNQVTHLREALTWLSAHRQAKYFALWKAWRATKQQERQTVAMAVGFRRRFFSRKYLTAWHGVVAWQKRKKTLTAEALTHHGGVLSRKSLNQMKAYVNVKTAVRTVESEAHAVITSLKLQRAVNDWRGFMNHQKGLTFRMQSALTQYKLRLVRKAWRRIITWWELQSQSKWLTQRATVSYEQRLCGRIFAAWRVYMNRLCLLRQGIHSFKARYFRNIAEECFYHWVRFVTFKKKVRALKHRHELGRQRRPMIAWHQLTQARRVRERAGDLIVAQRRKRVLSRCLAEWEATTTDSWVYMQLVQAQRRRSNRRSLGRTFVEWRQESSKRARRRAWRVKARQRHADMLRLLLQNWADECQVNSTRVDGW